MVVEGKHDAPQTSGGQMMANINNGRLGVGSKGIFRPDRSYKAVSFREIEKDCRK